MVPALHADEGWTRLRELEVDRSAESREAARLVEAEPVGRRCLLSRGKIELWVSRPRYPLKHPAAQRKNTSVEQFDLLKRRRESSWGSSAGSSGTSVENDSASRWDLMMSGNLATVSGTVRASVQSHIPHSQTVSSDGGRWSGRRHGGTAALRHGGMAACR